jgi:hypothetical protein
MTDKLMTTDPVIDEIHQIRREISDRFGGDLHAILADARQRQAASGHPVWSQESVDKPMHTKGSSTLAAKSSSTPSAD